MLSGEPRVPPVLGELKQAHSKLLHAIDELDRPIGGSSPVGRSWLGRASR